MSAFSSALDALFRDPSLGRAAVYEPESGEPVPVRVIARRTDAVTEFGGGRLWSDDPGSISASLRCLTRGQATASSSTARPSSSRASRCAIASGWCGRSRCGRHEARGRHQRRSLLAARRRDRRRGEGGDRWRHAHRRSAEGGLARAGDRRRPRPAAGERGPRQPLSEVGQVDLRGFAGVRRAAEIADAFDRGVLIRSKHGLWLAIPTAEAGTRGLGRARITPGGWERRTGMRPRFVFRRGRPSLLVADDARINARGLATAKRGRRPQDGMLTGAASVVIFILVPQVRLRKRLDLDREALAAAAALPAAILAAWDDT